MEKKIIFIAMITMLVLLAACTQQKSEEISNENVDVYFADGMLFYMVQIEKPTPCHTVSVNENIVTADPLQVSIEIIFEQPAKDVVCAQVVTPETLNGEILTGEKPSEFSIYLRDEKIFSTSSINELSMESENSEFSFNANLYCESDDDCTCGIITGTAECGFGNRDSIEEEGICEAFCGGETGRFDFKCEHNQCVQMQ